MDLDPGRTGSQPRTPVPPDVRIPLWLAVLIGAAVAVGVALGAATGELLALRIVRAGFFGSAFGYLAVSLLDFCEHFRLEKQATGHYFRATAIPIGETLNHAATTLVVVAFLVLARPPTGALEWRDGFVLAAPVLFLALGWRDELVYHRRRAQHREDIMHTVAHLAAAAMMSSFVMMRMIDLRLAT